MTKETADSKRGYLNRSTVGRLLIALIIGVPLIVFVVLHQLRNHGLRKELDAVQEETRVINVQLADTRELQKELDDADKNYGLQTRRISNVIQSCRQLEDLWEPHPLLCMSMTAMELYGIDRRFLMLPKGNHVLVVLMKKVQPKSKKKLLERELRYPLTAGSYFVELNAQLEKGADASDPRDLTLRITSSNPDFRPVAEKLLDHQVTRPIGTMKNTTRNVPFFPNQVDHFRDLDKAGVSLETFVWEFKGEDEAAFNLEFEVRLESDGPQVVQPLSIHRVAEKDSLKYLGDGRYEILRRRKRTGSPDSPLPLP